MLVYQQTVYIYTSCLAFSKRPIICFFNAVFFGKVESLGNQLIKSLHKNTRTLCSIFIFTTRLLNLPVKRTLGISVLHFLSIRCHSSHNKDSGINNLIGLYPSHQGSGARQQVPIRITNIYLAQVFSCFSLTPLGHPKGETERFPILLGTKLWIDSWRCSIGMHGFMSGRVD